VIAKFGCVNLPLRLKREPQFFRRGESLSRRPLSLPLPIIGLNQTKDSSAPAIEISQLSKGGALLTLRPATATLWKSRSQLTATRRRCSAVKLGPDRIATKKIAQKPRNQFCSACLPGFPHLGFHEFDRQSRSTRAWGKLRPFKASRHKVTHHRLR